MKIIFTEHAKEKLQRRKITQDEAINTIIYPEITNKIRGKYYAQKETSRGKIEVVYTREDKFLKVITLYWI
ncbi:MAG: DUF4258 domain-containing protein [Nanoarchaeota archaeon]|nr:DUF4258 domain-containing protein [Nanoarchaeota archaeon]